MVRLMFSEFEIVNWRMDVCKNCNECGASDDEVAECILEWD